MTETLDEMTDHHDQEEHAALRLIPDTVSFHHPFFLRIPGTHFRIREGDDEPVMVTPLEQGNVDLRFPGIISELKLKDDSDDAYMLDIVTEALNYVQGIGVGDPVPSEMTTGQASWDINEEHRAKALARLSAQLVHWIAGNDEAHIDADQLDTIMHDEAMKARVNEAFGEAAERLGLGRDQREEVVSIVNGLAEEMAYIEALRAQYNRLSVLDTRLTELAKIYSSEMSMSDTIIAVQRLYNIAKDDFNKTFKELDTRANKIMEALQNVAQIVKFIRNRRDLLHKRLWAWHELIDRWEAQQPKHSAEAEKLIHDTYHFLAQRHLPQQEWELFFKALERNTGKSSEKIW